MIEWLRNLLPQQRVLYALAVCWIGVMFCMIIGGAVEYSNTMWMVMTIFEIVLTVIYLAILAVNVAKMLKNR